MSVTIPILRIFDYQKAIEFYVTWLGFIIDWEHQFEENTPVYLQVTLNDITLHLSEHHGDCAPGARVFIDDFKGLASFHQQLLNKQYRNNRPGIDVPFYDDTALEMTVHDPFHNRLTFVERNVQQ